MWSLSSVTRDWTWACSNFKEWPIDKKATSITENLHCQTHISLPWSVRCRNGSGIHCKTHISLPCSVRCRNGSGVHRSGARGTLGSALFHLWLQRQRYRRCPRVSFKRKALWALHELHILPDLWSLHSCPLRFLNHTSSLGLSYCLILTDRVGKEERGKFSPWLIKSTIWIATGT